MTDIESAERALSRIKRARRLAAFLVVVGVGGELLADRIAEPFRKVIDDAREEEIGQLNKDAADAKLEQERLRAENLKLETRMTWRQLSEEQQKAIAAKLSGFTVAAIDIIVVSGSSEVARLSGQLHSALTLAGWHPALSKLAGGGVTVVGLVPQIDPDPSFDATLVLAGVALAGALNAEGVETLPEPKRGVLPLGAYSPGTSGAPLRIWLGDKP